MRAKPFESNNSTAHDNVVYKVHINLSIKAQVCSCTNYKSMTKIASQPIPEFHSKSKGCPNELVTSSATNIVNYLYGTTPASNKWLRETARSARLGDLHSRSRSPQDMLSVSVFFIPTLPKPDHSQVEPKPEFDLKSLTQTRNRMMQPLGAKLQINI